MYASGHIYGEKKSSLNLSSRSFKDQVEISSWLQGRTLSDLECSWVWLVFTTAFEQVSKKGQFEIRLFFKREA